MNMNAKYYVRVGNVYFKNWGESGIEPTFVLPDQIDWEKSPLGFEDWKLAEAIAKQLGGVVVLLPEEFLEASNNLYVEGERSLVHEKLKLLSDLRRNVPEKW